MCEGEFSGMIDYIPIKEGKDNSAYILRTDKGSAAVYPNNVIFNEIKQGLEKEVNYESS